MTRIIVVALLGITAVVVMIAAYHSVYRMADEYMAGRRRFAWRVVSAPMAFVLLALIMWMGGERFLPGAVLFLILAWLAIIFWGEL